YGSIVASAFVLLFSVSLATFPGEWANERLPSLRIVPLVSAHFSERPPHISVNWTSLHELLFAGGPDPVTGRPQSWFSNRLILNGQSFVEPEKLANLNVTRSFRGRDFRNAVLANADLRKADFTGANLFNAILEGADLRDAHLSCSEWDGLGTGCANLQHAHLR